MFLQKITTFILVLSLSIALGGGVVAQAQTNEVDEFSTNICPINGFVEASFLNVQPEYQVEENFSAIIGLSNPTNYTLAGVRVGIAAYTEESSTVPAYWTVLPDEYQLLAGEYAEIPVLLNLSNIEAGKYSLDIHVIQGDEVAVLGSVIRDGVGPNTLKLVKEGNRTHPIDVSVKINEQPATGSNLLEIPPGKKLSVDIETQNNGATPLLDSHMIGVVTQGEVPLGAAVLSDLVDSAIIIPGSKRNTKLQNNLMLGSELTVYAALVSDGALQPIVSVPVQLRDDGFKGSWAYVSAIGLSDLPLNNDSEVVTCVAYVGEYAGSQSIHETLAVDSTITVGLESSVPERILSFDTGTRNYFVYKPQTSLNDFTLTTNFLQKRFASPSNPAGEIDENSIRGLAVVDEIKLSFNCSDSESCAAKNSVVATSDQEKSSGFNNSFWFYAGIVIAAALLMYIMLRRLGPEDDEKTTETSPEELQ